MSHHNGPNISLLQPLTQNYVETQASVKEQKSLTESYDHSCWRKQEVTFPGKEQ